MIWINGINSGKLFYFNLINAHLGYIIKDIIPIVNDIDIYYKIFSSFVQTFPVIEFSKSLKERGKYIANK